MAKDLKRERSRDKSTSKKKEVPSFKDFYKGLRTQMEEDAIDEVESFKDF